MQKDQKKAAIDLYLGLFGIGGGILLITLVIVLKLLELIGIIKISI